MDDSEELVEKVLDGQRQALGELLIRYRERLERIISFRMDRRLRGRIDPADVIQETYLEATARISEYIRNQKTPFFLWLRFLAVQKLITLHRTHLGVKARDAGREVSLYAGAMPGAASADLAARLLGKYTTPSQAAMRVELKVKMENALNSMDPIDREILALRHIEQLTNAEAAEVLEINPSAASNRYLRAIRRLKVILDEPSSSE